MRKIFYNFAFLCILSSVKAQIPNGYYDSATGTGYTLKTQLYNIIKNHTTNSYGNLWNLYKNYPSAFNDNWYDASDTNKILDIYSENPSGPDAYTYTPGTNQCTGNNANQEGLCYNREHIIPQSVFNENSPMVSDPFHIWPTDYRVNGERANLPYGVVQNATFTSTNGSKKGNNLNSGYSAGFSGTVFEPIDEFKGDIARAYFYFATRYQENGIQNWNYEMFNGTKDKVFKDTFLKILVTWHTNDPVSPREIALNNAIYSYQNNRNPFIDHPEYVAQIWGNVLGTDDFNFQERKDIELVKKNNTTYTVILKNKETQIEEIRIYNTNGQLINTIDNRMHKNNIDLEFSKKGVYIIKVLGKKLEINKKVII